MAVAPSRRRAFLPRFEKMPQAFGRDGGMRPPREGGMRPPRGEGGMRPPRDGNRPGNQPPPPKPEQD